MFFCFCYNATLSNSREVNTHIDFLFVLCSWMGFSHEDLLIFQI